MRKVSVALLGFFALALVACPGPKRDDTAQAAPEAAPTPTKSGFETQTSPPYDQRFIDTMKAHHDQAIQMARMAVDKTSSAEVRTMAQKMIADQERDEAEMRSWREQWFPGAPDVADLTVPGAEPMTAAHMERLQPLSGHDFDHAFIEMMIPHHESAIAMGRDAATKGEHEEVRRKGQEIADKQQREVEELKKMLDAMAAH